MSVARACRAEEYVCPAELREARTAALASLWARVGSVKLEAGVDVEEVGVGMAFVEDVDADVDVDAGSDAMSKLSSWKFNLQL